MWYWTIVVVVGSNMGFLFSQISIKDETKASKKLKQMTNTNVSLEKCKQAEVVEVYDLDSERAPDGCAMESAYQNASVIQASLSKKSSCRKILEMEDASLEKADMLTRDLTG